MEDNIKYCTALELKELIDKGNCQIIDVREVSEYESVRIKDSKSVPLTTFEEKLNLIDKKTPIYLQCGVGKRAQKAAEFLSDLGYKNLYVVEGGIKAWIEAGYPVEVGSSKL